jgi:hypothetical protein
MKVLSMICFVVCLCFLGIFVGASPPPAGYHLIKKVPLAAASGGVELDAFTYRTARRSEGMIHIFHEDSPNKLSEVETVKTEYGAKTMALDPKTHDLYLTTSDFDPAAAPTEKQPNPLPRAKPGNFRLLVYGR